MAPDSLLQTRIDHKIKNVSKEETPDPRSTPDRKIPRVMIFTHKTNLLGPKADPKHVDAYFDNVVKTIQKYTQAWKQKSKSSPVRVWFLDNDECVRALEKVKPELVEYYKQERDGSYKGDICRGAALYLTGGIYFDVDMEVISPVELLPNVTVSTAVTNKDSFFNSYMASSQQSSVMLDYLRILLYFYKQGNINLPVDKRQHIREELYQNFPLASQTIQTMVKKKDFLGTRALAAAIQEHRPDPEHVIYLLREDKIMPRSRQKKLYPKLTWQNNAFSEGNCCCNWVVHDPRLKRPYFFSRFVSIHGKCRPKEYQQEDPSGGQKLPQLPNSTASERNATLESLGVEFYHLPNNNVQVTR